MRHLLGGCRCCVECLSVPRRYQRRDCSWDRFTGSRRPKPPGADDRQHGQYGGLVSPNAAPTNSTPTPNPATESIPAGDYPSGFVSQWVDAATRVSMTRTIYGQMQIDLAGAIRGRKAHFQRSKDYQKALDNETQTYADYLDARQKALESLDKNPRYQELRRLEADLGNRLLRRPAIA